MNDPVIKLECLRCDRRGQYTEERLFELTGTRNRPDARIAIARLGGCERALKQDANQVHDRCEIQYVLGES